MKKLFNILLLCSTFISKAQTNVYHPFPEANAQWNFNAFTQMGACHKVYSIVVYGDTIINSTTYYPLVTYGSDDLGSTFLCNFILPSYLGAIRNDSANKKVFIVPPQQQNELILYDFDLQVGDSVKGYLALFSPNSVIYEKDSVLVNGNYRNRLKVDSCYNISFIEGVGSIYGLTEILPACITDATYYLLECFKENNVVQYPENVFSCNLIDGVSAYDKKLEQIQIWPNPSDAGFKIEVNGLVVTEMMLYDINGRIIRNEQLNNFKSYQIQDLNSGFYSLQIKDQSGRLHHFKLIKTN